MYKRLKTYRDYTETLLLEHPDGVDWDAVAREHLVQITFFQHERLIHLLVTLAFALMELVSALATTLTSSLVCAMLTLLFLVLLVPYVVHYYHLENGTQALYVQYDRLRAMCSAAETPSPR